MKLFLSPHNDDETLFGAWTIMRERPTVCVVFDSWLQQSRGVKGCNWHDRRDETMAALRELTEAPNCPPVIERFLRLRDDHDYGVDALVEMFRADFPDAEHVWAPLYEEGGHEQHNQVARAASTAFESRRITWYSTYTRHGGKSTRGTDVIPRSGDDIARKLRALACYRSQLEMDPRLGCWPHFMNDLREYVVE